MKPSKPVLMAAVLFLTSSLYVTGDFDRGSEFSAETVSVTDGDTIDVRNGKENFTVRLLGVDTPETYSSNNPEEFGLRDSLENRECLEKWGERATGLVREELADHSVSVETDPDADRRGTYGRLLAYIHHKNSSKSVNLELVEEGYGRLYESDFSRIESFRDAERNAIEKEIGIWSC